MRFSPKNKYQFIFRLFAFPGLMSAFLFCPVTMNADDISEKQATLRTLRYISHLMRDKPPDVHEAQDFWYQGKSLESFISEWKNDEHYEKRLIRMFNDWFGTGSDLDLLEFNHYLHLDANGIYSQPVKGSCQPSEAVSSGAWWLEPGQQVKICPNMHSEAISFDNGAINCSWGGDQGILNARCGCGPDLILCLPLKLRYSQLESARHEFGHRAWFGYQNQQTWQDILGGNYFVGNRYLYHAYLISGTIVSTGQLPTASDLNTLKSLSPETVSRANFPDNHPERAGVVTAPGFLQQFNNFRSRIRALSEQLLCQDISGSLNTHQISHFVNQDLSDFDKAHGQKESCSSCHYPMDNMGSALLNWNAQGQYESWANLSQKTFLFGLEGEGPLFLMKTFVNNGPGLLECLSKKIWEDFTGTPWGDLAGSVRDDYVTASQNGPTELIHRILATDRLIALRYAATGSGDGSGTSELNFDIDIKPIIERSCSGSSCHSTDTSLGKTYDYESDPDQFLNAPVLRLESGSMPPPDSGKTLSEEQKNTLINYLKR